MRRYHVTVDAPASIPVERGVILTLQSEGGAGSYSVKARNHESADFYEVDTDTNLSAATPASFTIEGALQIQVTVDSGAIFVSVEDLRP